jgi:Na+-transporting methylmalonyl-CoA/oxaloacetate decarboxylase gamma subunit
MTSTVLGIVFAPVFLIIIAITCWAVMVFVVWEFCPQFKPEQKVSNINEKKIDNAFIQKFN